MSPRLRPPRPLARGAGALAAGAGGLGGPDPRPAAARDLVRPPARPAFSGHRAVRDGDPAAAPAPSENDDASRRAGPSPRPRGQHLGAGAAPDRGLDARHPRPRAETTPAARHP